VTKTGLGPTIEYLRETLERERETARDLKAEVDALRPVYAAALKWIAEDCPSRRPFFDALVDATLRAEKALQALCLHPKAGDGACPDCGATFFENG
jgi:hypothetical protein